MSYFVVWTFLIGAGVAASWYARRRRTRWQVATSGMSDEQFISFFSDSFKRDAGSIIAIRKELGETLGLPVEILLPEQKFSALSRRIDVLGSFDVGLGDLGNDLELEFRAAGVSPPNLEKAEIKQVVEAIWRLRNPAESATD